MGKLQSQAVKSLEKIQAEYYIIMYTPVKFENVRNWSAATTRCGPKDREPHLEPHRRGIGLRQVPPIAAISSQVVRSAAS